MTTNWKFTSESVTPGHPDRLSDNIVENVLSEILTQDPNSRIALEGLLGKGFFTIAGELTTEAYVNIERIVRNTIQRIGYDKTKYGLDARSVAVLTSISEQSPEIAGGVFNSLEQRNTKTRNKTTVDRLDSQGAGDQGIVFGSAVNHNIDYHPVTHKLSMMLAERLYDVRQNAGEGFLYPDGKTQVTVDFVNGKPVNINTVLVSTQHADKYSLKEVQDFVTSFIIEPVIYEYNQSYAVDGYRLTDSKNYIINPAGKWSVGASAADVGLVNRKIVADTTGGWGRHGGGGLNGKDFSKTDRSGVYAARYAAKNLVAAGLADQVEIQIGYAIGQAKPVSVYVNTFGTGKLPEQELAEIVDQCFDFRPLAIREQLSPTPEAYQHTAMFGHLGRNPHGLFLWENLDQVENLKKFL